MIKNNLWHSIVALGVFSFAPVAKAQVQPIQLDRNILQNNPKAYCTPIPGQAVYDGAVVTVPVGHECSSWLNYLLQQEITEKNIELKREENETNAKLQLYLNTTPQW